MALFDLRDVTFLEGDSSSRSLTFTIFLDQVATVPVEVSYYVQSESASEVTGDLFNREGRATVPIGADRVEVIVTVRGDTVNEGNETFELVVIPRTNAELPNGVAALSATATIFDNDDPGSDPVPGEGALAERLSGPTAEPGVLPTLGVRDVSIIEGNISSDPANFLITLDRPATAVVTGRYFFDSNTAAETTGDYFDRIGTFTIQPGQTATYVTATVRGDTVIEPNETFSLVLYDVDNAVLDGGAAVLEATATILDDDGGAPAAGGIGAFAGDVDGAVSASGLVPTVRAYDVAAIEGNSSTDGARFLITLDRPADARITMNYATNNGTATADLGDYLSRSGTVTFEVGEQAQFVDVAVSGDVSIEGDETFTLVLSDLQGAVFENEAAALTATATILDDDSGSLSGTAGRQDPAVGVAPPVSIDGNTIDVVDVSLIEANTGSETAGVYLLLSEPAAAPVTLRYQTIDGTAIDGVDYFGVQNRSVTFATGEQSTRVGISVRGDNDIEGEEQFTVQFSQPSGAVFANGQTTMNASVVIYDNDDGGVIPPTVGPEFTLLTPTPGATAGNDLINGTGGADILRALDGNDRIFGGGGNDILYGGGGADFLGGGAGADTMVGGGGNDFYIVDNVNDVIAGEIAFSLGGGIDTVRTFINNYVQPDNIELVRLGNIDGTSNFNATGNDAPGTLVGNAGNNQLTGRGGNDQLNGNGGNDRLIGNTGRDTLVGGDGSDTFVYNTYSDSRAGALNRDVINGFGRRNGDNDTIDLRLLDANTRTFGVDDAFNFIGNARFSGQAGELRTQNLGGPNAILVEADHNGDRVADFQIFVNVTNFMTGSDFLL